MTTWAVPVLRPVPTWNTQTPDDGAASVRMPEVSAAVVLKQYTPGASRFPPSACPVRLLAGEHVLALRVVYAVLKALNPATAVASPWWTIPAMLHDGV